jgi:LPXTG-motif cell wall-anchored protein
MRLKNIQRTYRLSMKARSEGVPLPHINTEGDILSTTKLTKRSRLTKAVTLFALAAMGVIASPVAATFASPENITDDTPAAAPARSGNDITGNDGGASTATGGIQIDSVTATRQYDKATVGSLVKFHVDYSGKKVTQGATFTVSLGEGLKVPAGMNTVALKATTLDGSHEENIGECTVTDNGLNCEITADIAATLGGNGDLKAAYVDFQASIDEAATGKKSVDITVAGTTYTVSMGDGVVGENYDKNPGKGMWSDGMENGLHRHRGYIWTGELPGGTAVTITDTSADVLASKAYCTANHSWAKKDEIIADNNKMSADKHTITFNIPAGDNINCRVAFKMLTEGLDAHNEATINGANFVADNKWHAKGGSGGSTDEDAKPVTPEPTPTPDPTPEPPKPDPKPTPDPTPEPSEPPAPTPEPTPEPSEPPAPTPEPTPEPSTPPVTPDPTPEPPAPTPDPTPEAPKPDPKPEPTPDVPKPDPKPTPEQPTPDPKPEPSTPPVTPDPEPSVPPVTPDPEPSVPPVTPDPKPSEPPVTPEPSTPPATPEPKPSEPTTPVTPVTPVTPDTPSTPNTPPVTPKAPAPSAPVINGGLAKTGADAGLIAGAGVLAVAGGALLVARRRQNKN